MGQPRGSGKRSFDIPDEIRQAGTGRADVLHVGGLSLMRFSLPAGWRWSRHVKPLVRTKSCQVRHIQYVVSGHVHIHMDDGSELDLGPGEVAVIEPGHDACVVGDKPFVAIEVAVGDEWSKAVA